MHDTDIPLSEAFGIAIRDQFDVYGRVIENIDTDDMENMRKLSDALGW